MNWWAVQCHKEALANLWLGRYGYETYFPHERVIPHWRKTVSKRYSELVRVKALIPSYLFVKTTPDRFYEINAMHEHGVSRLVRAPGGEPFPISEEVLSDLRKALASAGGRNPAPSPAFSGKVGDLVRGKEGWLHWGLVARVVRISGQSVALRMMMFGSGCRELYAPGISVEAIGT